MDGIFFTSIKLFFIATNIKSISFLTVLLAFPVSSEISKLSTRSHMYVAEDTASHSFSDLLSIIPDMNRHTTVTGCAVLCLREEMCHGFYYNNSDHGCRLLGGTFMNSTDPQFNKPGIIMYRNAATTATSADSATIATTTTTAVTTAVETTTEIAETTEAPFHCPTTDGFQTVTITGKNYCVLLVDDKKTFAQARKLCKDKGAILYHFDGNMDKFYKLNDALYNPDDVKQVWVGMHTLYGLKQWTWDHNNRTLSQEEADALPWEDDGSNIGDTCLQAELVISMVDDKDCEDDNRYLCEKV